jgi:ribose transport system permease protein
VGTVVALINPLFLSPINLGNTANLIGLFGLFAIGQAFVIITGGIDCRSARSSRCSASLFVDLMVTHEMCRGRSPCSSCWCWACCSASSTAC